jgi:YwiC-like protein
MSVGVWLLRNISGATARDSATGCGLSTAEGGLPVVFCNALVASHLHKIDLALNRQQINFKLNLGELAEMMNQSSVREAYPGTRNSSVVLSGIDQNESGQTGAMNSVVTANRPRTNGVRIRPVALPVEHGGWGLTLEPIALGLLLAPSRQGALLAVATIAVFLARHPLKILAADRRHKRRFPRTRMAERFVLLYGAATLLSFGGALFSGPRTFLWPVALAVPLASIQLGYDLLGRSRALWPELAGSAAMAAVATSLALAGGWAFAPAFALWVVLAARVVPTIMYVRAQLMRNHGQTPQVLPVVLLHVAGFLLVLLLAHLRLLPVLAVGALALLLLRAAYGLSGRQQWSAKKIGLSELGFGALTVLAVVVGHSFNL